MRLFGKVDGAIDRFDRAEWLSMPFDLAWEAPVATVDLHAFSGVAQVYLSGFQKGQTYLSGFQKGETA